MTEAKEVLGFEPTTINDFYRLQCLEERQMDIRDRFAVSVVSSVIGSGELKIDSILYVKTARNLAKVAYLVADAMLKERAK